MESVPTPATKIRDVAAHAGVAVSTVSRVLNDSPSVSETTRSRVLRAIAELDYRPSRVARNLSLRQTHAIAVLIPFFKHASTLERLNGVVGRLASTPYDLVLVALESPARREEKFRLLAQPHHFDGVLAISLAPSDADVERFRAARVPVVLVDAEHPECPRIVTDDFLGGQLATRHLLDLGHRRIAYLGDPPVSPYHLATGNRRRDGCLAALGAAGVPARAEYFKEGPHDRVAAHRLTVELLDLPEPPTAIFAGSDTQALGVLEAAERAGVRVPEELSVLGFDDVDVAPYVGLTTVRQPLYESGTRGVEVLLEALSGAEIGSPVQMLPLELAVRKTTGPPPG